MAVALFPQHPLFPTQEVKTRILAGVLEEAKKAGINAEISVMDFGKKLEGGDSNSPYFHLERRGIFSKSFLPFEYAEGFVREFSRLKKENDLVLSIGGSHAFALPTHVGIPKGKIILRFDAHGDANRLGGTIGSKIATNSNYISYALKRKPLKGEDKLSKEKIVNVGKNSFETREIGQRITSKAASKTSNADTICVDADSIDEKFKFPTNYTRSDAVPKHLAEAIKNSAAHLKAFGVFELQPASYAELLEIEKTSPKKIGRCANVAVGFSRLAARYKLEHLKKTWKTPKKP